MQNLDSRIQAKPPCAVTGGPDTKPLLWPEEHAGSQSYQTGPHGTLALRLPLPPKKPFIPHVAEKLGQAWGSLYKSWGKLSSLIPGWTSAWLPPGGSCHCFIRRRNEDAGGPGPTAGTRDSGDERPPLANRRPLTSTRLYSLAAQRDPSELAAAPLHRCRKPWIPAPTSIVPAGLT